MLRHTLFVLVSLLCMQVTITDSGNCDNSEREGCGAAGTKVTHSGSVNQRDDLHAVETRDQGPKNLKIYCPINYTVYFTSGCNRDITCNGLIVSVDWILSVYDCFPQDSLKEQRITAGYSDHSLLQISQTAGVNASTRWRVGHQPTLYRVFREEGGSSGGFVNNLCIRGWIFQITNDLDEEFLNIYWFYGQEPNVGAWTKITRLYIKIDDRRCELDFAEFNPQDYICAEPLDPKDPIARVGAPVHRFYGKPDIDSTVIGVVCKIDAPTKAHLIAKITDKMISWLRKTIEE